MVALGDDAAGVSRRSLGNASRFPSRLAGEICGHALRDRGCGFCAGHDLLDALPAVVAVGARRGALSTEGKLTRSVTCVLGECGIGREQGVAGMASHLYAIGFGCGEGAMRELDCAREPSPVKRSSAW